MLDRICAALTLLMVVLPTLTAMAQPRSTESPTYVHEIWTVDDGLPINSVVRVVQGPQGYLWMATFDGLVRFDGVRFEIYSTSDGAGLPSNRLIDLLWARDGSLWLRTEQQQVVRYREGVFSTFGTADDAGPGVLGLHEDAAGTLWIGTDGGLSRFEDGRLSAFAADHLRAQVTSVVRDRSNMVWVGTQTSGLYRFEGDDLSAHYTAADGLSSNYVSALLEDSTGALWIGTDRGVHRFRGDTLATIVQNRSPWPRPVEGFAIDSSGLLWISTIDHLFQYGDGVLAEVEPHSPDSVWWGIPRQGPDGHWWIKDYNRLLRDGRVVFVNRGPVTNFLHDPEGNVWMGGGGLHRLKRALFTVYSVPEGLASGNVYPIFEGIDETLWFGTQGGGLSRLRDNVMSTYTTRSGLPSDLVYSIYQDREEVIWVGHDDGVCRFEEDGCLPLTGDGLEMLDGVRAILEDRNGILWFGAESGLYRYDRETGIERFTTEDGVPPGHVRVIVETADGDLWIGTNGGGLAMRRNGRFEGFSKVDGLSSNHVRVLYEDGSGVLWAGTEDEGLNRIELNSGNLDDVHVTVIRAEDGLFDNVIHSVVEDRRGRFWMSTNRGIFWVERDELNAYAAGLTQRIHSTSYTDGEGLRNKEANGGVQHSGIRARDGRLWFATQDGAVVIDPDDLPIRSVPPPVIIEQLGTDGSARPVDGPTDLGARQRNFEISYTALNYGSPKRTRFRYRLEPFDTGWIDAGTRRTAYYTNVPAGTYRFHVTAAGNEGVWNEQGDQITLTIAPFFYETPFFYLLLAFGVVGTGISIYRWRIRRLESQERALRSLVASKTADLTAEKAKTDRQARRLRELNSAQSKFFANVTHELRTPLTLIRAPLRSALDGTFGVLSDSLRENMERMARSSARLERLIDELLVLAKSDARTLAMNARRDDLGEFLRRVASAFMPLAEDDDVSLILTVPPGPCRLPFDADQMEKVVGNLISNAIKFSPAGREIHVGLRTVTSDRIRAAEITVRDHGEGISPEILPFVFDRFYQGDRGDSESRSGMGIGLAIVREIVDLHGGEVDVQSTPGEGTSFRVRLPMPPARSPAFPAPATDAALREDRMRPEDAAAVRAGDERRYVSRAESTDRTTVLIVDDHADMRAYLRTILTGQYRVLEAADGREGLEVAQAELPDLILADVMMPRMNGHDLARAVKADSSTDCIPIVLLTARAGVDEELSGFEVGADDYVTKPFEPRVLAARIDAMISRRRRLIERLREERDAGASGPATGAMRHLDARLREVIEENLDDPDLSVDRIVEKVPMSYSQFNRRLKEQTGLTPSRFIRTVRLERAATLLSENAGTISEVAYAVGFQSLNYFSRCFREHFDVTPSEYALKRA